MAIFGKKITCDGCGEQNVCVVLYVEKVEPKDGLISFMKNAWGSMYGQLFSKRYFYCIECLTELEEELDAASKETKSIASR